MLFSRGIINSRCKGLLKAITAVYSAIGMLQNTQGNSVHLICALKVMEKEIPLLESERVGKILCRLQEL